MEMGMNGAYRLSRHVWRTRQQLRLKFHALLRQALRTDVPVCFVSLSGPPGQDQDGLSDRHRELVRRVEDRYEEEISYVAVRTRESNGVIHALWFFLPRAGGQVNVHGRKWTAIWNEVNGESNSRFLWMGRTEVDAAKLAQYMAYQPDFVRSYGSRGLGRQLDLHDELS